VRAIPTNERTAKQQAAHDYYEKWYRANRDKQRENAKAWRQANPDYSKNWYKANTDQSKATAAAWYKANEERAKAAASAWGKANRERLTARTSALRKANPELYKAWASAWHKSHPTYQNDRNKENPDRTKASRAKSKHDYRTALAASGGSFTGTEWRALVDRFDGRCVCCGSKPDALTADHVIAVSRGGANVINNIQPLCMRCNISKGAHHSTDYRDTPFTRTGRQLAA
jgi:5-methylcytosine-specific restriction endonuclease McrA